jgi:PAS domain S-box-containing protein
VRPVRDGLIVGLVAFLSSCLCLTVFYRFGAGVLRDVVCGSLIRTAQAAAGLVEGDLHRTFVAPEQENTEAYRRAVEPLRKMLRNRPDIRFLYTMILRGNRPHIILDATPPGDADKDGVEDHSPLMQPYDTPAPGLLAALRSGEAGVDSEPVRDQWGSLFSGYAPIRDSKGQPVGVVGIDMDARIYTQRISSMRRALLFGWLAALAVSAAIGIGTWRLRRNALVSEERRHIAAIALRQSEVDYRRLVESTPDIILRLDADGRYRFVSPSMANYHAGQPEEFLGKTHRELAFPPEQCAVWEDAIRSVLGSGRPCETEMEWNTPRGRVTLNVRLFPEQDRDGRATSVLGIVRDITEHRAIERSYRMLFEQMVAGFALHEIVCDADGKPVDYRFLAVNPAFERQTGLKAEDLIGRTVKTVMPDIEQIWIDTYGRVALTGVAEHFENFSRGLNRHYEVTAYRPAAGQFACVFTDITARKQMEEERRRVSEQLQHVQKLEGLGLLAGGIAHDFNNLLMAILGNVDLTLEEVPRDSTVAASMQEIKRASLRAADLCKQMLAYSGKGKFVIGYADLSGLVRDITNLLEVSISKKAVLRYHLADGLPAVAADVSQIRQVVMNLVINASEAIGDRSGAISVTTGVMECDASYFSGAYISEVCVPGRYVYLEVADSGCGMNKATQARMFDPFFTTKFTGRGLGLAAVLGIVRGHKGAIKVYSEEGRGTSVKILLPATDICPQPDAPVETAARWRGSGTVLLVDDEEAIRSVAKRMLERIGFEVLAATNGQDALAVFRNTADRLACVVMDLTMPHMDGDAAFREMRRIKPAVPVILSSGYNQQEVAERLVGKGLDGFMQKPYQLSQMVETLQSVIGKKQG